MSDDNLHIPRPMAFNNPISSIETSFFPALYVFHMLIMHLRKTKQEPVSESCFFIIICSTFIICNQKSQILPGPSRKSPQPQPIHFPEQFPYPVRSKRSIRKVLVLLPLFPCFPRNISHGICFRIDFLYSTSIYHKKTP